jgi:hypothetical protein
MTALVDNFYQLYLCTNEQQYQDKLEELKVPRAERGGMLSTPQSDATLSTFDEAYDADGKRIRAMVLGIRVDRDRDPLEVVGLIVHECVHIFQNTCRHIGELHPSTEFEAYGIQRLTQDMLGEYRSQVFGK